jgi:hypothetical protein
MATKKKKSICKSVKLTPGIGFLIATFLVQPFLPEEEEQSREEICNQGSSNATIDDLAREQYFKIYKNIFTPYRFFSRQGWLMHMACLHEMRLFLSWG